MSIIFVLVFGFLIGWFFGYLYGKIVSPFWGKKVVLFIYDDEEYLKEIINKISKN